MNDRYPSQVVMLSYWMWPAGTVWILLSKPMYWPLTSLKSAG
jgi:hypothetical protein